VRVARDAQLTDVASHGFVLALGLHALRSDEISLLRAAVVPWIEALTSPAERCDHPRNNMSSRGFDSALCFNACGLHRFVPCHSDGSVHRRCDDMTFTIGLVSMSTPPATRLSVNASPKSQLHFANAVRGIVNAISNTLNISIKPDVSAVLQNNAGIQLQDCYTAPLNPFTS
jgi:hypothetical protein